MALFQHLLQKHALAILCLDIKTTLTIGLSMIKFLIVAFILGSQSLSLSSMQRDEPELAPITRAQQRIWRSVSAPDLGGSATFENRFGYDVIILSSPEYRHARAISDASVNYSRLNIGISEYILKCTYETREAALEGTSSTSESSDWAPSQHTGTQPATSQVPSSKLNRIIAIAKCIIN